MIQSDGRYAGFLRRLQPPHDLLDGVGLHVAQQALLLQVAREHLRLVERVGAAHHDLAGRHPVAAVLVVQAEGHALDRAGIRAPRRRTTATALPCRRLDHGNVEHDLGRRLRVSTTFALPAPTSARCSSLLNGGDADALTIDRLERERRRRRAGGSRSADSASAAQRREPAREPGAERVIRPR